MPNIDETNMLIILGGLPATGKTTIAKALTTYYQATYLRIDTLEQTLKTIGNIPDDISDAGYQLAYALAEENLKLGQWVIADSVNSIELSRKAWRTVAQKANRGFIEIEIICSDKKIHQQRAEQRLPDIQELAQPTWKAITERIYEPWLTKDLTIDTATTDVVAAIKLINAAIR